MLARAVGPAPIGPARVGRTVWLPVCGSGVWLPGVWPKALDLGENNGMRPATVIALGILLLFLFGAFILQFVVLGSSSSTDTGPDTVAAVNHVASVISRFGGVRS